MDFFNANNISANLGLQRYSTSAAEWYRESWIKSCTLERSVPEPPAGVVRGPCVREGAKLTADAAGAKPAVDLLDLGAEPAPVVEAPSVDLLDFGQTPAPAAQPVQTADADLLGFGSAPGTASTGREGSTLAASPGATAEQTDSDLLGFGSASAAGASEDLLGLGGGATAPLDLAMGRVPVDASATPAFHTLPHVDLELSAPHTLAGGAKLVEKEKDKKEDMFAMALEKWGM